MTKSLRINADIILHQYCFRIIDLELQLTVVDAIFSEPCLRQIITEHDVAYLDEVGIMHCFIGAGRLAPYR